MEEGAGHAPEHDQREGDSKERGWPAIVEMLVAQSVKNLSIDLLLRDGSEP
jgi:hypothetical protein